MVGIRINYNLSLFYFDEHVRKGRALLLRVMIYFLTFMFNVDSGLRRLKD